MYKLVELQVQSANRAIGNTEIQKIYIDGGFAYNEIYIKNINPFFSAVCNLFNPIATWFCAGRSNDYSAKKTSNNFLKEYYEMQKHEM